MSNCPDGMQKVPTILLLRWIDELVKMSDLMRVLYRSVSNTRDKDTHTCAGDDVLAQLISDRLADLFVEIEEVKDGCIEDKL